MAHEITEEIRLLNEAGRVTKMSVVGYSLGGLISRYAIGILYHQGVFEQIEPVNFTTFCTPHVGVLTPGSNLSVRIFNALIPNVLSLSGKQMFLKDVQHLDKRSGSLLEFMAMKNSVFYKALQSFKYRALYANCINDKRTSWWTSGIAPVDPFINIDENSDLNELSFRYVDGYAPVVLDADAQISITSKKVKRVAASSADLEENSGNFWSRKWRWVIVASNLLVYAPIWVVWFLVSNIMEQFKSYRRITSAVKDHSEFFKSINEFIHDDIEEDVLKTALLDSEPEEDEEAVEFQVEESLQKQADTLMESVWDAMTSKTAVEQSEMSQFRAPVGASSGDTVVTSINALSQLTGTTTNKVLAPFQLALNPTQTEIVCNLNDLGWEKYPILIRKTRSTHSAAIVRDIADPQLAEGRTVVAHWLHNVFRLG